MSRTVAQKMGVTGTMRACIVQAPPETLAGMGLPQLLLSDELRGTFDYLHLFCRQQDEMNRLFPRCKAHLKATGMLWLSWPKGRRLGSNLSLPTVINIGYRHGLVESTCLRVDDTWAGLKFTHPVPGKRYHNSYGTLPPP